MHSCICWVPMTWMCVLAVMLVATLVATHSHSPWSSLVSDLNCKLPRGKTLCLLLLGFPTCSPARHGVTVSANERETERGAQYAGTPNEKFTTEVMHRPPVYQKKKKKHKTKNSLQSQIYHNKTCLIIKQAIGRI